MSGHRFALWGAVCVLSCVSILAAYRLVVVATNDPSRPGTRVAHVCASDLERRRVTTHLRRAEAMALAADVSRLSPAQRTARTRALDALHEYIGRGVYPHNHVIADRRTPVFVDEHGTHCAVGYLIARSGNEALVQRVAHTRNLARVPELAGDAELRGWLDASGVSLAEAAMIQPWYGGSGDFPVEDHEEEYATATMLATGLNGGMIAWNLLSDRAASGVTPGIIGMTLGLGQLGLGLVGVYATEDFSQAQVVTNISTGVVSFLLGVRSVKHAYARGAPATTPSESSVGASIAPWTAPTVDAGVQVALRF